jgi:hypothetical protein
MGSCCGEDYQKDTENERERLACFQHGRFSSIYDSNCVATGNNFSPNLQDHSAERVSVSTILLTRSSTYPKSL